MKVSLVAQLACRHVNNSFLVFFLSLNKQYQGDALQTHRPDIVILKFPPYKGFHGFIFC